LEGEREGSLGSNSSDLKRSVSRKDGHHGRKNARKKRRKKKRRLQFDDLNFSKGTKTGPCISCGNIRREIPWRRQVRWGRGLRVTPSQEEQETTSLELKALHTSRPLKKKPVEEKGLEEKVRE